MRRGIVLILACLLVSLSGKAEEYYTLEKLRDDIAVELPNGWQEKIETQWRTVEIDTQVIVPDAERMPILALRAVQEPPEVPTGLETGWTQVKGQKGGGAGMTHASAPDMPDFDRMKCASQHYYAPVDMSMPLEDFGNRTLQALSDELMAAVESVNQGKHAWDTAHPYDVMVNTYTDPKTRATYQGYVNFLAYESFCGIPLIRHIGYFLPWDLPNWSGRITWNGMIMGMDPYGGGRFTYQGRVCKVLQEDVPLVGFSKVQSALRREVEAGHIRKILCLQLGDSAFDLRDDPEGYTGVACPIWYAQVWWTHQGRDRLKDEEADYPTNAYGRLEYARIAIDAQTGEIISAAGSTVRGRKRIKGLEVYQGSLTWEDVR